MLGPQASNQFHSTASLNPNKDSVGPKDDRQAMRRQSLGPLQREPGDHENNKRAGFVSLGDEMKKSKPESEHYAPSSPRVFKSERESPGQHPFGLLVKEHTKGKTTPSTSFSSIRDLELFIESMKRSFLMPGNVMHIHFQTARETIANEMASNTQNVNIMGQHDEGYSSYPVKEGTVHDDASGNKDWREAMTTAIDQGANYQMPSKSLSAPNPVDAAATLISTSVYDNRDDGPGYALSPLHHLVARADVSSNYGGFHGGISGGNPDRFTRAPRERNKGIQSTSYNAPKQMPFGSFFGKDLSFSGHVTATPVNPPNSPAHNFRNYSSTKRTTEKNLQQRPKYTFKSKASLTKDRKRSGLKFGKDVKSQELSRVTSANILTTPMPPSFNSYGHVVYVSEPRGQHYNPDYQPEHRKRVAKSSRAHQPIVGQQSNYINPTARLPVSTGHVPLSSNNPSPQNSSVLVGVQTSSPHNAQNLAFIRKKPVGFYTTLTAQPSSGLHGPSRHDGYLQDRRVNVSRPSTLTAQPKDEKSDASKQNRVTATRRSKQKAEKIRTPVSSRLDSTKTGISSLFLVGDANVNSITNLAPTSASERPFSRLVANNVRARNFGINNEISDIRGARKSLGFSSPLRRGISRNRDYASATRPGGHAFRKLTKLWKRRGIMNKKPGNVFYYRPKLLSASPSVNSYIVQSRNSYLRSKGLLYTIRWTNARTLDPKMKKDWNRKRIKTLR